MKIAAAYVRVSTDDQLEFSPDSQLKNIKKYAKDNDMILPEEYIFIDEGISGRNTKNRAAFLRMVGIAQSKPKPFDVILVWKFSRFARNREDSVLYKSMLRKKYKIDVVSISEPIGNDNTSIILEAMLEAMDEFYSANLSQEVKRGMTEKFSRGGVVSQPPFGYIVEDGIFVPDKEKAPIVQMMYNDFLNGMKMRQIAEKLNNMGITSNRGNRFDIRTVEYILTNVTYTGKMRRRAEPEDRNDRFLLNGEILQSQGGHEPIIDDETFNRSMARVRMIQRIYSKRAKPEGVRWFELKGLIRCDNCGSTLVMTSAKDGKYLQCNGYYKGLCSVSHSISIKKITDLVIKTIQEDLVSDSFVFEYYASPSVNSNIMTKPIEQSLKKEYSKLERIKEAYLSGLYTVEECSDMKRKVEETIEVLKAELKNNTTPPPPIESFKKKMKSILSIINDPNSSIESKNIAFRTIISKIILYRPSNSIKIFYNFTFDDSTTEI